VLTARRQVLGRSVADAFGNAIGNSIVGRLSRPGSDGLEEVQVTARRIADPSEAASGGTSLTNNPAGVSGVVGATARDDVQEVVITGRCILPGEDVGLDVQNLFYAHRNQMSPEHQERFDRFQSATELHYRLRQSFPT
jgi:hypothetical protein